MEDEPECGGRPPPTFTTLPIRACSDKRLTGTDLRVLGVIGFHDRRSLVRGAGAGCFAGQRVIAKRAGLDRKNVRVSIERLVKFGYLQRTERTSTKRGYVLRVIEADENAPAEPTGGAETPYAHDEDDFDDFEQGDQEPPQVGVQEPPHRGLGDPHNRTVRDLAKARTDSPEGARSLQTATDEGFPDKDTTARDLPECKALQVVAIAGANLLGSNRDLANEAGVSAAHVWNAKNCRHVSPDAARKLINAALAAIQERKHEHPMTGKFGDFGLLLPAAFPDMPPQTQLCVLERTLKMEVPPEVLESAREPLDDYLMEFGHLDDHDLNQQALRIADAFASGEYG